MPWRMTEDKVARKIGEIQKNKQSKSNNYIYINVFHILLDMPIKNVTRVNHLKNNATGHFIYFRPSVQFWP